jgi:hypothetical protein
MHASKGPEDWGSLARALEPRMCPRCSRAAVLARGCPRQADRILIPGQPHPS